MRPPEDMFQAAKDETLFWLTQQPTVGQIRELNRDALHNGWTLTLLGALMDAGVDIDAEHDAVLGQRFVNGPELIDCVLHVTLNGKLIAIIGMGTGENGSLYFPLTKRREKA